MIRLLARPARRWRLCVAALAFAAALPAAGPAGAADGVVTIEVLSGRADLVSGGDALVEVSLPAGVDASDVRVDLGGRDVSDAFGPRPGQRFGGLVTGLRLGPNLLTVVLGDGSGARMTLTNHPVGGPVFAGPQVEPWLCTTEANGLGAPVDDDCNTPAVYRYEYKSTAGAFAPYDPENPPSDVATTTTDEGKTVPYVVRIERGVIDRGIYDVAVLFDPETGWPGPWARPDGWNGKMLIGTGQGCETNHEQQAPADVVNDMALSRGYMVAATSMTNNTQNCNDVVQAEAQMMLEEHITEAYGPVRFTIGSGCSGGSMAQYQMAANYPGLLDGIQPACSFPDGWTTYQEMADCKILSHYFLETSPHLWTEPQRARASGHASSGTCEFEAQLRSDSYVHASVGGGCAGYEWTYDAETNPDGERCTIQDYQVAVFGRRDADGFANRPWDNVGVQYGLTALEEGSILPSQFVDLNAKIGGLDIDGDVQAERSPADAAAVPIAYRSGRIVNGHELAKVPIMDLRGSSNAEEHYDWHSHAMRNRLLRDNGHADNFVYWNSPGPLLPHPPITDEAFDLMDRWLTAIEADRSPAPPEVKVVRHKPEDAVDACWLGGEKVTDQAACDAALPYFREARFAAGGPDTMDVVKCRLKPLRREDYSVTFTDAEFEQLQAAFPTGVCDYARKGVAQQPPDAPWMTFADGPGGRPLGRPPTSVPFGEGVDVCAGVEPAGEYVDRERARSVHRPNVDCVIARGISVGHARSAEWRYAPRRPVTRGQMATFVVNTLRAAGAEDRLRQPGRRDAFTDIAGSVHRAAINRLAASGVVQGVGGGRFDPGGTVTRAEMATFMVAAAELVNGALPDGAHAYGDVGSGDVHARSIAAGTRAGLFTGTTAPADGQPGRFDPDVDVPRDQMATFLVRLLRHTASPS